VVTHSQTGRPTTIGLVQTETECALFQAVLTAGVPDVTGRCAGFHIHIDIWTHLGQLPDRRAFWVRIWDG
jgi:hypothetical protein